MGTLSCNGLKTVGFSEHFQYLILNLGRCTIVTKCGFGKFEYPCETREMGDPILSVCVETAVEFEDHVKPSTCPHVTISPEARMR